MNSFIKLATVASVAIFLGACDVDQTEEGEMPDVNVDAGKVPEYQVKKTEEGEMPDVNVEGGNVPEYDVEGPDVEVGTEKKEVTVPTFDVDVPDEDEREEESE